MPLDYSAFLNSALIYKQHVCAHVNVLPNIFIVLNFHNFFFIIVYMLKHVTWKPIVQPSTDKNMQWFYTGKSELFSPKICTDSAYWSVEGNIR